MFLPIQFLSISFLKFDWIESMEYNGYIFACKVNIWNANSAQATTFISVDE